jgi:hypothetical protein
MRGMTEIYRAARALELQLTTTGLGLSAGRPLAAGELIHDFFDHRIYVHYSVVQK